MPEALLIYQQVMMESVDDWPMAIIIQDIGGKPKPVAALA